MRTPEPILVVDLLPPERTALLSLLRGLASGDWARPTIAGDWTVKDVAAHLVADDLGRLSGQRDGHREPWDERREPLKAFIDRRNHEWVVAMRRLSPRVLVSLLELGGRETQALFESLDLFALAGPVSWAGPDPAPVWLDLARELTERWHHQQQIRDAVGAPRLEDPLLLRAVLETFAFALPPALAGLDAREGTAVGLRITGPSGGTWSVVRLGGAWQLRLGTPDGAASVVTLDEETAWRMYVRALPAAAVRSRATIEGDAALGDRLLGAFALVS